MTPRQLYRAFAATLPPLGWLPGYRAGWLQDDALAGLTLAAYAVPVSLAYATLAGLPPQVGIYGYLLGGLGYALLGSSRHLAIGPTSAISLMIATTVGEMAQGDVQRYAQIASLAALVVAALCLFSWLLRLSALVKLVSDSILVGFRLGAGLTIALTQLPSLLGLPGNGDGFIESLLQLGFELGRVRPIALAVGATALVLLFAGERLLPGKPIALCVLALSIVATQVLGLADLGVEVTGSVPAGLPVMAFSSLRIHDVDGILPLAGGCLLLAYIESISAGRTFAAKHDYAVDPRQELLGIGMANLAVGLGNAYPVAGGLSQSAVNEKAGARTPLALVFASAALALSLVFFTGWLEKLPKAVLAAVVLTAIVGLLDFRALARMRRVSPTDFYAASFAFYAVLLVGILPGLLLSVLTSIMLLVFNASRPHVAFLGRIPDSHAYSDMARHPENLPPRGAVIFRPEGPLLYVNTEWVYEAVLVEIRAAETDGLRLVVCDLSTCPRIDLAGARLLRELHGEVTRRGGVLRVVGAHGRLRDLLRADGLEEQLGQLSRFVTLDSVLHEATADPMSVEVE